MKSFESYILSNEVVKAKIDYNLAKGLIGDAQNRFDYHIALEIDHLNSKYILEN